MRLLRRVFAMEVFWEEKPENDALQVCGDSRFICGGK